MTLQELVKQHGQEWVGNSIVKLWKFYVVHIGDGTLYCGTEKHLEIVNENNTLIYKLYNLLQK